MHLEAGPGEVNPSDVTLLLTRPAPAARRFAVEAEAALGSFADVVIAPLQEIAPIAPLPDIPASATLVFTSENGVRVARNAGLRTHRAFCVGDRTAAAARDAGFDAASAGGDAEGLVALILGAPPTGEIVHLSGTHQRGDLAERLTDAGIPARRVAIYDQRALPLTAEARDALTGPRPTLAPLFSPRSARLLADAIRAEALPAPALVAHMSAAVARAWPWPGRSAIGAQPDSTALLKAMAEVLSGAPPP